MIFELILSFLFISFSVVSIYLSLYFEYILFLFFFLISATSAYLSYYAETVIELEKSGKLEQTGSRDNIEYIKKVVMVSQFITLTSMLFITIILPVTISFGYIISSEYVVFPACLSLINFHLLWYSNKVKMLLENRKFKNHWIDNHTYVEKVQNFSYIFAFTNMVSSIIMIFDVVRNLF